MKTIRVISTIVAFLLLGAIVPSYARQDKPEKQDEKPSSPKQQPAAEPQKQQHEAKPQQEAKGQQEQQQKQQQDQAKPNKQQTQHEQQHAKGQQEQQKQQQEQTKSNKQQNQHSVQPQNVSYKGPQRTQEETTRQHSQPALLLSSRGNGRIPDERFHSSFGRGHEFRMGNPVMVGGYSRFQYGGYWFGYVQPWPVGWYYTDQFYIDYQDGGYYMYDPYYPGTRFAITVVL